MEVTIELWTKSTSSRSEEGSTSVTQSSTKQQPSDIGGRAPHPAGLISIARFIMAARSLDLTRWVYLLGAITQSRFNPPIVKTESIHK